MNQPFIDLTPEFRSAVNQRRRSPLLRVWWIGFALGCAFTLLVVELCAVLSR